MQLKIAQIANLQQTLDQKIQTITNVGSTGVGIFSQKSGTDAEFFKLVAGTGINTLAVLNNVITIGVDVGVSANKIVALDANARLPTIDGRNLTNLTAANIIGNGDLSLTTIALAQGHFFIGNANNNPSPIAKAAIPLSGFGVPTNDIDIGARKIFTSASAWAGNELVPKSYVDSVAQGQVFKQSARVATVANISLSAPGASIDGITLNIDDRVLVKNQSTGSQNGVYLFKGSSTPMVRSEDADSENDLRFMAIYIEEGTHAYQSWRLLTEPPITVGTTELVYSQISGSAGIVAGDGLLKTGQTMSVKSDDVTIGLINSSVTVKSSGTNGQVLRSTGNTTQSASWGALDLANTNATTGILPVSRGGLGINSISQYSLLVANTANTLSAVTFSNNQLIGRKTGNIVTLSKTDVREIIGTRPVIDVANAVAGNMKLITLSQTPDDASKVLIFFNGVLLRYNTHYTIAGVDVNATNAFNIAMGGTGSDGLGFNNQDTVIANYIY